MMRFVLTIALGMLVSSAAHAVVTYTFVPAAPTSATPIQLRIDTNECMLPIPGIVHVNAIEPSIDVEFHGTDTGCDPAVASNMISPRFHDIGILPVGNYTARIYTCGFGPQGTTCTLVSSGALAVQDSSGTRFTVPALSKWGGLGLLGAVLFAGLWSRRRA